MFKKLLSLILLVVFLFPCTMLTACKNEEPVEEYKEITLTTDNYSDYIAINVYYTDYNVLPSDKTGQYTTYYHAYCIAHIETSRKMDCHFQNVTIRFAYKDSVLWTSPSYAKTRTTLDYNGYSHSTISLELLHDSTQIEFPISSASFIKITEITGIAILKN